MMEYIGLFAALLCNTALALLDKCSSKRVSSYQEILCFSFAKTAASMCLALCIVPWGTVNINSAGILVSLGAGIFHAASVVLIMRALKLNPAVHVNLFMSAGVLLPALWGNVFLGQPLSVVQCVCLPLLIVGLALMLGVKRGFGIRPKCLFPMFLCYGMLMVMQALFSQVCRAGSNTLFSAIMYGFSTVILGAVCKKQKGEKLRFTKELHLLCVGAAVLNLAINLLLTGLSARIHAAIVFPVVHGIKLVAITMLSSVLWKEKLTVLQILGSLLAILCVCGLSA